jgi:G3E family GTPase
MNKWLQQLCDKHADTLCRMKAVLWCKYQGRETRVVVQGTYGQFEWSDSVWLEVNSHPLIPVAF